MKSFRLKALAVSSALLIVFAFCGCTASQSSSNSDDYADDEAMDVIASGLEARWAITDSSTYKDTADNLKKAINAEIEKDSALKDRQFENSKMQEDVLDYIDIIEDSLEVVENNKYQSETYYDKWDAVYNKRAAKLKTLVDSYGLAVSDSKKSVLDELVSAGTAAQDQADRDDAINSLFKKAKFKKTNKGYGYYEYSATIKNSTDYSFEDVGIVLSLYDKKGVKAEEIYASTNSWEKGEKVRFESTSEVNAEKVKVSVDYYSVKE